MRLTNEAKETTVAYLLFAGDHYYPSGGAEDLQGRFDTLEDAVTAHKSDKYEYDGGWAHVLCVDSLKLVKTFNRGNWDDPYWATLAAVKAS